MYYPNLEKYPEHAPKPDKEKKTPIKQAVMIYATKQGRKAAISLGVLALSYVPYVGRFVLPAASFYTFKKSVGTQPAAAIFAGSLLFPRRYLVSFLQAYFSSRTLMRELVRTIFNVLSITSTNLPSARALLCTRTLHPRAEEALVQGSSWRTFRFRPRLLHLRQDPTCWRPHLRSRRSLDSISHYQDHRTAASPERSRQVQRRVASLEEQARVLEPALATHGRIQPCNAQAPSPV